MSATLFPPAPAPTYPRPLVHRWTVAEFNRMGDMGWFEGKRAFLLDGVILEQGPTEPPHATGLALVDAALRAIFGAGWLLRIQSPLHVNTHNDPLPDLAVVPGGPRDYAGVHPTTATLVVEVSDTTLNTDLTAKAERYATANIADYWVLDLNARQLHVFRDPQPIPLPSDLAATAYRTHLTFGPTDRVSPLAAQFAPHAAPTVPSHSGLRGATASVLVGDLLP